MRDPIKNVQRLSDSSPMYVAYSPDKMPSLLLYEGDLTNLSDM